MYFLLGISLVFALLLVLNVLASIGASVLWRAASKRTENWTAQARARFIFALRVFPVAAALVAVFAFLLPAYILFEPHRSSETVGVKLAFLSLLSAVGVGFAFYRVFQTRRATRRLIKDWMKRAEPIKVSGVAVPVYKIRHPFPVIAVVGALRPRMFVAEQIFETLETGEFQAAIWHETGHLAACDNFKRAVMRVCRDLLVFPFGKTLDRAWAEEAEAGADEYAAQSGGDSQTALNLAAALIKIARIVPAGAKPSMPAGAFLIEQPSTEIAFRVQKLLQMTGGETSFLASRAFNFRLWFCCAALCATLVLLAADQNFLLQLHNASETVVALLQ